MEDKIRVFVGCSPNGEDIESQIVLEYSLKKHCSMDVEIHWMKISSDPNSPYYGWDTSLWATPFSGFRWAIPEICNFARKAIYMDSDMIILSDLAKLWNQSYNPGKVVITKGGEDTWRFCVCMWNNAFARDYILPIARLKEIPQSHRRMMNFFSTNQEVVQAWDGNWNCIDMENFTDFNGIDILHYSDMSTQPHLKYAIPRLEKQGKKHWFDGEVKDHPRPEVQKLFDRLYKEALDFGYKVEDYMPIEEIQFTKESQSNYGTGYKPHKWAR